MSKTLEMRNSNNIEDAIIKKFGKVFVDAADLHTAPPKVIPTTPQMDIILSGGIPEGSFCLVSGPPKLGKSSLSLHFAGNAQKIDSEFGPRKVFYFDIEGRIKIRDISCKNLDTSPEKFTLIKSTKDKIITGEEFIAIGEELIRNVPGAIFIFDSFSAICTQARYDANIGDRFRDDAPLLLSSFCKRISQIIPVNKSIVIGITHRIANQGPGMKVWTEASGQKIQYQTDVKIKGTHVSPWNVGDSQIGQDVHWECETSALGPPGSKATCKLRYKEGYDEVSELVDLCVSIGRIKKAGAWFTMFDSDGKELTKTQGAEKMRAYLCNNTDIFEQLKKSVYNDFFDV